MLLSKLRHSFDLDTNVSDISILKVLNNIIDQTLSVICLIDFDLSAAYILSLPGNYLDLTYYLFFASILFLIQNLLNFNCSN